MAAILFGLMALFPKDGILLFGDIKLEFPNLQEFLSLDTTETEDIDDILAKIDATDSIPSDISKLDSADQARLSLHYPSGDKTVLYPFFEQLDKVRTASRAIHIMHYGDSQIEGDRMTGFIRSQLQSRFGGSGPGLLAIYPLVNSFALISDRSEHWTRHTMYGVRDPEVQHNGYGAMAVFSRFTPVQQPKTKIVKKGKKKYRKKPPLIKATASWTRNSNTYRTAGKYTKMRLFYGNSRRATLLKVLADGKVVGRDTLAKGGGLHQSNFSFSSSPNELSLELQSRDGPDFYGISLESSNGVMMDNMAWRGSAGTLFSRMDPFLLRQMLNALNVKLLVLQFGGNAVPAISSLDEAKSYGISFRNQIRYLKDMLPGVPVIVIGPADMSEKVKGKMVTREYLVPVRDAVKKGSLDAGAAFYDLYEVMGGLNSMPKWVNKGLAGSDYVHMTVEGSHILAEAFYKALMRDYESYKEAP